MDVAKIEDVALDTSRQSNGQRQNDFEFVPRGDFLNSIDVARNAKTMGDQNALVSLVMTDSIESTSMLNPFDSMSTTTVQPSHRILVRWPHT